MSSIFLICDHNANNPDCQIGSPLSAVATFEAARALIERSYPRREITLTKQANPVPAYTQAWRVSIPVRFEPMIHWIVEMPIE